MKRHLLIPIAILSAALALNAEKEAPHPVPPAQADLPEESIYALDSTWQDQNGKALKWSESAGTPRVVALGYATCKGICPRIIADMQRIEKELAPESKARFTFITLDPESDDQAALKTLADNHKLSERWDVLRSEEDALLEMAVILGVRFDRLPNGVDFAHSYLIATIAPDGRIVHKWIDSQEGPEASVKALKAAEKP
ncbi:MAG: SCO family protein [Luteolibacter sp.]